MSSRILNSAETAFTPINWSELGPGLDELLNTRASRPAAGPGPRPPAEAPAAPPDWELRVQNARDEGRREAEAAARQAAAQEIAALQHRLLQSIESVATLRPRLRLEAERQVVELAIAVARRVLRRQITIDPDAVAGLVRSALDDLSLREVVSIRCHPASTASIQAGLERLGAPPALRIEPDPSLEAGAVLVETTYGVLDASVTTQLEEIERGFTDLIQTAALTRP
jgi:flagellar assembly protein FliH